MGYIGQSRSERSQQAIDEGLLTKNQLKAWQKRAVEQGVIRPCEWHHTGKYFNKTEYYDPMLKNQQINIVCTVAILKNLIVRKKLRNLQKQQN